MCWWPNQLASTESGACILIPNEQSDQDTFDYFKTDQDTDQETWILISLNTKYSIFAASIIAYNNNGATYYSFLDTVTLIVQFWNFPFWKTTHQIQFPKQCILKFWTMWSKSFNYLLSLASRGFKASDPFFFFFNAWARKWYHIQSWRPSSTGPFATSITNFDNQ